MTDDTFAAPALIRGMNRRSALKLSALGAAAASPFLTTLGGLGAAAAQSATDYKALVCVFLYGGNDDANTIVPVSTGAYGDYTRARPALALPGNRLLSITPDLFNGPDLALSASMPGLRTLFQQGRCAILANVGTLAYPLIQAEWRAGAKATPFQLFSHSDQQGAWQTGLPDRVSRTGWLGRIGDLIAPNASDPDAFSLAISVAGNNAIQVGQTTVQYQVTPRGPVRIEGVYGGGVLSTPQAANALQTLMTQTRTHVLEDAFNRINSRAITSERRLAAALASARPLTTPFPATALGDQARMVARMISINATLGQRRQIFFISSGGWDFHDNLLSEHAERLAELDGALTALFSATVELGLSDKVTTFTASDFGRALQSNGRGSDHGWGGHHFIVGGAVKGRRVFGSFPTVALNGPNDSGQGRLIPTTAVDQYASTLARWFGVGAGEMTAVLPNLARFGTSDLGFMN